MPPLITMGYKTCLIEAVCPQCYTVHRGEMGVPRLHIDEKDSEATKDYYEERQYLIDQGNSLRLGSRNGVQSPIEDALRDKLFWGPPGHPRVSDIATLRDLQVQHPVGPYFADFAFPATRVVVECDGHEFHERTKEQAAHDRQRDRYMQCEGWLVLRFTGSEIHKNAFACAEQVLAACRKRSRP